VIAQDGVRLAALLHDGSLGDEPELLGAVSAAAGIALQNGRLQAELRAGLEELKRSRERVIEAGHVVCESLANIAKHARAKSVTVDIARADGELVVEIVDDGVGGADSERGTGLRGLADRVEALDGRLRVWTPRGGGTRVRAEMPCA
jgi:signal transduction histidine kinase